MLVSTVSVLPTPLAVLLPAKFTTYVFCEPPPSIDIRVPSYRSLFFAHFVNNSQNGGY